MGRSTPTTAFDEAVVGGGGDLISIAFLLFSSFYFFESFECRVTFCDQRSTMNQVYIFKQESRKDLYNFAILPASPW